MLEEKKFCFRDVEWIIENLIFLGEFKERGFTPEILRDRHGYGNWQIEKVVKGIGEAINQLQKVKIDFKVFLNQS